MSVIRNILFRRTLKILPKNYTKLYAAQQIFRTLYATCQSSPSICRRIKVICAYNSSEFIGFRGVPKFRRLALRLNARFYN